MIKLAQEELDEVEGELASLRGNVRLDDAFFWKYLVDVLKHRKTGATSSELLRVLKEECGLNVSPGGLRVFLSRYKQRGRLTLGMSERDKWELSPSTMLAIAKLER